MWPLLAACYHLLAALAVAELIHEPWSGILFMDVDEAVLRLEELWSPPFSIWILGEGCSAPRALTATERLHLLNR